MEEAEVLGANVNSVKLEERASVQRRSLAGNEEEITEYGEDPEDGELECDSPLNLSTHRIVWQGPHPLPFPCLF